VKLRPSDLEASGRGRAERVFLSALLLLVLLASSFAATFVPKAYADAVNPLQPPFLQCNPVVPLGADTSCEFLVVLNAGGAFVERDPSQVPYDTISALAMGDDVLVGVQSNSTQPILGFLMSGPGSFAFDGDECAPGENVTLTPVNANYARVTFGGAGLAAGASTYFCLEAPAAPPATAGQPVPLSVNGAPIGLVDYGTNGMTGAKVPNYTYAAHQFLSTTKFVSLSIGNSSNPTRDQEMSLQLNVMTYGISTSVNNGTYWTQDVMSLDSNSSSCPHPICYQFFSEFFNMSSGVNAYNTFGVLDPSELPQGPFAAESPSNLCTFVNIDNGTKVARNCDVLAHQSDCSDNIYFSDSNPYYDTYVCGTPQYDGLTLPFAVSLKVTTGIQKGGSYPGSPFVSFSYQIDELGKGSAPSAFTEFDKVYFDNRLASPAPKFPPLKCAITWVNLRKGVLCPAFVVSGVQPVAPNGFLSNDAESVLCGPSGASVTLRSLEAYMKLFHDGTPVPHAWSFGADTAEKVTDVRSSLMLANGEGWKANPGIGADNFEPLY